MQVSSSVAVNCPICSSNLASLDDEKRTNHVNACLDGRIVKGNSPIPKSPGAGLATTKSAFSMLMAPKCVLSSSNPLNGAKNSKHKSYSSSLKTRNSTTTSTTANKESSQKAIGIKRKLESSPPSKISRIVNNVVEKPALPKGASITITSNDSSSADLLVVVASAPLVENSDDDVIVTDRDTFKHLRTGRCPSVKRIQGMF
jgi:hypothetical protein